MMRTWIPALAVCVLVACGAHHGGDDDESIATLSIAPATSDLLIENGVPAHQDFTATLTFPDGHDQGRHDETTFLIDSTFGSFTANRARDRSGGQDRCHRLRRRQDRECAGDRAAQGRARRSRARPRTRPICSPRHRGSGARTERGLPTGRRDHAAQPRRLRGRTGSTARATTCSRSRCTTEFADVRVYLPGGNGAAAAGPMPT